MKHIMSHDHEPGPGRPDSPAETRATGGPDQPAARWLFTGVYGTAWVLGSVVIGVLFDVSLGAVTAFCVAAQLAALPLKHAAPQRSARCWSSSRLALVKVPRGHENDEWR
jgi:hypothetical protein